MRSVGSVLLYCCTECKRRRLLLPMFLSVSPSRGCTLLRCANTAERIKVLLGVRLLGSHLPQQEGGGGSMRPLPDYFSYLLSYEHCLMMVESRWSGDGRGSWRRSQRCGKSCRDRLMNWDTRQSRYDRASATQTPHWYDRNQRYSI